MEETDQQLQVRWNRLVQQWKVAVSQRGMWFPGEASDGLRQHEGELQVNSLGVL